MKKSQRDAFAPLMQAALNAAFNHGAAYQRLAVATQDANEAHQASADAIGAALEMINIPSKKEMN